MYLLHPYVSNFVEVPTYLIYITRYFTKDDKLQYTFSGQVIECRTTGLELKKIGICKTVIRFFQIMT